jgi:hypothetical protein
MITLVLKKVVLTCFPCPTQYEAETDDGKYLYFGYRWGSLNIDISESEEQWEQGKYITGMSKRFGGVLDGICQWQDFLQLANEGGFDFVLDCEIDETYNTSIDQSCFMES